MSTGVGSPIAQVQAGLAALTAVDAVELPDEQVRAEVLALLTCLNQVTGALLARIGAFDARDLARADAQRATSTWLVDFGSMSKRQAVRWLAYARLLTRLPALAEAARAGRVSAEQLAPIAELVRHIGVEQVRDYDQILADLCASAGPAEVARACARIWALVDPDGAEPDPMDDFDRREITFSQLGTMLYIRGRLDPEGAAAVQAAVDALMRPPAPGDDRTAAQRRADAIVDLARGALANGELPTVGGEQPQVGLLVTPEILFGNTTPPAGGAQPAAAPASPDPVSTTPGRHPETDRAACACGGDDPSTPGTSAPITAVSDRAAADDDPLTRAGVPPRPEQPWLAWVGEVSPDLARRLACDGTIWRLVLDPRTGLPLDVGRRIRIVPWWMRKALRARDRTCRWPGCDVPADWTDAHHLTPWWQGGVTAVEQLISLCRYHHGLVHEGQWILRMDHATGEVRVWRPNGRPYELGPSRPWTGPSQQGPRRSRPPQTSPATADPPDATHPPGATGSSGPTGPPRPRAA
jgi:Domain of unknown function DUF222.